MTVAEAGVHDGKLLEIVREEGLETDDPNLVTSEVDGAINADLTVGADVVGVEPLRSNYGLGYRGVQLMGAGFIVTRAEAEHLGLSKREGLDKYVKPYVNGRDLVQRTRGSMVIDLFGLTEKEVRVRFPEIYQHLLETVKIGRAEQVAKSPTADAKSYLEKFWLHGKPRQELRPALLKLQRYVATVETTKHRIFQFVDARFLPDNMVVAFGSDSAFHLGVLSSQAHLY